MSYLAQFTTASEVQADIAAAARARRLAMNLTQDALSARSSVPIATLRRFEGGGAASLATVLAVAEALDALDAFADLFPRPEATTLDALEAAARPKARARTRRAP